MQDCREFPSAGFPVTRIGFVASRHERVDSMIEQSHLEARIFFGRLKNRLDLGDCSFDGALAILLKLHCCRAVDQDNDRLFLPGGACR
jgi:hypothetical protein